MKRGRPGGRSDHLGQYRLRRASRFKDFRRHGNVFGTVCPFERSHVLRHRIHHDQLRYRHGLPPGVSRATGAAMIMCANLTRSRMRRQKAAVYNWASGHAVQIRAVGDTTQYGRCGLQCSCPLSASTMLTRLLRTALPVALGATFGLQTAHADIYTWVDAAGSINVSNLAPPDDVHVTKVMHASASAAATGDEPARDTTRLAEMRALAERVRQLEDEVESARRQVPPPVDSRVVPMPPMVQYVVNPAPALAQYPVVEAPP